MVAKSKVAVWKELSNPINWDFVRVNKKVVKGYSAVKAQQNYNNNRLNCGAKIKIFRDTRLLEYIENCVLKKKWSPAMAVGNVEYLDTKFEISITSRTIYNYVRKGISKITPFDLRFKLRRKSPKHKKILQNKRKLGKSIEIRPPNIQTRQEFGHCEIDTVVDGANGSMLVFTERKTRFGFMYKLERHTADEVNRVLVEFLQENSWVKSFTADNGSEFYRLVNLENDNLHFYFTHAYCSWEKGSVENYNGIIRRYIPKNKNIYCLSQDEITRVQNEINTLPRPLHKYRSAEYKFREEIDLLSA